MHKTKWTDVFKFKLDNFTADNIPLHNKEDLTKYVLNLDKLKQALGIKSPHSIENLLLSKF